MTSPSRLAAVVVLVFLAFALFWPLGVVLARGVAQGLEQVLADPYLRGRLWWSLEFGLGSSLLVALLTVPLVYLLRWRFPGRDALVALSMVPFVLPTLVVATGLLAWAGPRGLLGLDLSGTPWILFWGSVLYNLGMTLRLVLGVLGGSGRLIEAARTLGASSWRSFLRVELPLAVGALAAGASLTFVYSFSSFGLPLILGGPRYATLEVEVYRALLERLAFGEATGLIVLQTGVLVLVTLGYLYAQRRLAVSSGAPAPLPRLEGARGWAALLVGAGFFAILYAPLWALAVKSFWGPAGFSLAGWAALARPQASYFAPSALQAAYNTLRFSLLALLLVAPLGFAYAYGVWKGARGLDLLGFLPLLVSPVSLAVGYLLAYPRLRASLLLLIMAYALIAYPLFARALLAAMRRLPAHLGEAARVLGAGPGRVLWRVELPLLRPALAAAAALAAAVTIGEFGATLVLARPEWATLTVAIYERLGKPGIVNYQEAMALSVLLGLLAGGVFWSLGRGGEVG